MFGGGGEMQVIELVIVVVDVQHCLASEFIR